MRLEIDISIKFHGRTEWRAMPEADVYRPQGFGQTIGRGTRPAFLVVGFVNGFTLTGVNVPWIGTLSISRTIQE